jgi:hypothetical protein
VASSSTTLVYQVGRYSDLFPWALGVWALGVWALDVWALGRAAGSPPGQPGKRALGRSLAAGFAPPWLVHPLSTSPPPPTSPPTPPRRRRPQNRADERAEPPPTPKTPPRRQRGLDSACILTLPRSGRNFFRRWMFVFRRWVLNIRRWVTNPTLGVGWHGPCVGRWMRWMPLARALGDGEGRRRGQRAGTTVPLSLGIGRVP